MRIAHQMMTQQINATVLTVGITWRSVKEKSYTQVQQCFTTIALRGVKHEY